MSPSNGISAKTKFIALLSLMLLFSIISVLVFINYLNSIDKLSQMGNNVESYFQEANQIEKKFLITYFTIYFLITSLVFIYLIVSGINNMRNLAALLKFSDQLKKGMRPGKIYLDSTSELLQISQNLNSFLSEQDNKIDFIKTLGDETQEEFYNPESTDILGNELKAMSKRHIEIREEGNARQAEERKRTWVNEGIAQFADLLRTEREDVKELSFLIIQKIVTYMGIEMGTLFLAKTEENERYLQTVASYGYDRRKYLNKKFLFGEGLPGTCALENQKIYINEIPDEYSDIISGVGQTKPKYVLLVPLKIEDELFGIIELASLRALEDHELNFIDTLAESIASSLHAVKNTERTNQLLQQSRKQAEKLRQQEEAMSINMEELVKAREESLKKESEITGILNAMNESSLVAEFNLNGRFIHINEKFLQLIEMSEEQVLGRHHREFARVEKYSDEYREFWSNLKEGENISKEEAYHLYSGKEIWLQQNYTPIRNQEGKIFKILNIAIDISPLKEQQENIQKQAAEITRKNLEMKSLTEAVDNSIIKCELDREGIILDANTNFTLVSGLNRKEILGRNYRLFLKDIEKNQFDKIWLELLKNKTYEGAIRRTKPTGEEVWLMSSFSPVKNMQGEIYKIYFLALDITEKKLKYQLLEEANKEIERLKKQFVNE